MALKAKHIYAITIIALIIGIVIGGVAAYVTIKRYLKATGKIHTVGLELYADAEGTLVISELDWGILEPGETKDTLVYAKSTSNVPVNLTMFTETWDPPEAESYITFSWDYNETALQPEEIRPLTFTLAVSTDITGITDFSFDIWIVAEG